MPEVKLSKKSSFGGGDKARKLIHQSDNPHFTPIFKSTDDIKLVVNQKWKEVLDDNPESKVYFEIIKGTAQQKNFLGLVKDLKFDDEQPIYYRGSEPHFPYEFFVIDNDARKLWSSGKQTLKGEPHGDGNIGWCETRVDQELQVPWKYEYDVSAERPCIFLNNEFNDAIKQNNSLWTVTYYSFFIKVLGDYLKDPDGMKTDWFESIFLKINDLSTLFDGEEDPLDVLRYSNEQTKLDWLYQVSESIFLNNEGQRHLEVLSTFKNL